MGWNEGYTIFEKQIITLYDAEVLTRDVLTALMEPFRGTDMDAGGGYDFKSKDGKSAEEIVCFIMEPEKYRDAIDNFVPDPDYEDGGASGMFCELWKEISRREWGLW